MEIARGQARDDTGMGRRAADVDVTEPRVRVRAPDDDGVEHAGPDDVVDVASAPPEERRILEPLEAYRFHPSQSHTARPMTSSRSRPFSQGSSSVNSVTHCRHGQGMRVMSVPQNQRAGPKAS